MSLRSAMRILVCLVAVITLSTGSAWAQAPADGNGHQQVAKPAAKSAPQPLYPIAPKPRSSAAGKIALGSMFATTAIVQGLDYHSTYRALDLGAIEANPLVKPFTRSKPAFAALKAGMAAGTIHLGRSLAKRSKTKAIIAMAAINSVHAYVVVRNYRASRLMQAQIDANGQ